MTDSEKRAHNLMQELREIVKYHDNKVAYVEAEWKKLRGFLSKDSSFCEKALVQSLESEIFWFGELLESIETEVDWDAKFWKSSATVDPKEAVKKIADLNKDLQEVLHKPNATENGSISSAKREFLRIFGRIVKLKPKYFDSYVEKMAKILFKELKILVEFHKGKLKYLHEELAQLNKSLSETTDPRLAVMVDHLEFEIEELYEFVDETMDLEIDWSLGSYLMEGISVTDDGDQKINFNRLQES